jgi:uncharacterized membrane protein YdjX (TVP38/TMEM64 family)
MTDDGARDAGEDRRAPRSGRALKLLPLAVVAVILVLVFATGLWKHLSLDELKARRGMLKGFVHLHPAQSVALYIGLYCAVVALSIPGALIMTLAGGFLFGPLLGGAAAAVGVSSGAVLMFLIAHTAVGDLIRKHAAPDGLIASMEAGVRRHAFIYIFSLRLMPALPIWLVNIAAAFVKTPIWIYALATILGIAPSCFIYASIGAGLDQAFAAGGAPTVASLMRPWVILPLAALGILGLVPFGYQAWRRGR